MAIRVLVVDDVFLIRAGITALLRAQPDISVVGEADNGLRAIELAHELRPDVVVMDVKMPIMDGVEATRQINDKSSGKVAVLILTTFDIDAFVYSALRAGAAGFVLKDTLADLLVHAVRVVAAGDSLLSPSVTTKLIQAFTMSPVHSIEANTRLLILTERERTVMELVGRGMSNSDIGARLGISEATAKTHLNRLMAKLKLSSRAQIVAAAYETALIRPSLHPVRYSR